jgi:hypothetical protein
MARIYLIGSLRNPAVPEYAKKFRQAGHDVFDDWHAGGPEADDHWQRYEQARGRDYLDALQGEAANHTFNFDFHHLLCADVGVLIAPAGKSAHLELGWMIGKGKRGYYLLNEPPERWDVMLKFAHGVFYDPQDIIDELAKP